VIKTQSERSPGQASQEIAQETVRMTVRESELYDGVVMHACKPILFLEFHLNWMGINIEHLATLRAGYATT
jgi:hypothetical protein